MGVLRSLRRVLTPRDNWHYSSFRLHQYLNGSGNFDYARYRAVQQAGNQAKLEQTWVLEENVRFLADYILKEQPKPSFALCHGVRRGNDQEWFREYLGCEVIGTEISPSATQFPHTIQWDFHEAKQEWLNAVDFIYSNSFDHSFDPCACLTTWVSTLKVGGICILEHSDKHGPNSVTELDPFGADIIEMPFLIAMWGKGSFFVREILIAPVKPPEVKRLHFLIIERRR
jgi:hypothetical protein